MSDLISSLYDLLPYASVLLGLILGMFRKIGKSRKKRVERRLEEGLSVETEGRVVDVKTKRISNNSDEEQLYLVYTFPALSGREHRGEIQVSSNAPTTMLVGREVVVRYLVSDPEVSTLEDLDL